MVKFRGGSRRRSYPQIGQRFIVDKPSLTLRLEVLQRRPTRAGKWTHDHERQDASIPHEMSLKSMDVFKWHGAGNVSRIVHQVRTGKSLVPLYSGRSLAAVTHYVAIASRI